MSSPEAMQPETTSGKKTPELKEPNSSSDYIPSEETSPPTGNKSGNRRKQVPSRMYQRIFVFEITNLSDESRLTLLNQWEWSGLVACTGVELEQANQGELGQKQEWDLTLKIPTPSFGVVTEVMNTLSLTNLREGSTSVTFCDGWIVTLSTWKPRADLLHLPPPVSGSLQILLREIGTQWPRKNN